MKYFAVTLLLLVSFSTVASQCTRFETLSVSQKENLELAYQYGVPKNYGFTLAALALRESNAGKWRVNFRSNDYGLMQINIKTAYDELGISDYYEQIELAEQLIYDDELSLYIATRVLDHFRQGRMLTNSVWREMVMRYNIGWTNTPDRIKRGTNHLHGVTEYVNMLQQCTNWGETYG